MSIFSSEPSEDYKELLLSFLSELSGKWKAYKCIVTPTSVNTKIEEYSFLKGKDKLSFNRVRDGKTLSYVFSFNPNQLTILKPNGETIVAFSWALVLPKRLILTGFHRKEKSYMDLEMRWVDEETMITSLVNKKDRMLSKTTVGIDIKCH